MRRMTRLLCLMLLFSLITFSCPLAEETDAPTGTPAPTPMLTAVPESALAPFNVVLPEDAHVEMAEGRITLVRGDSRVVAMVISRVPDEDPAAALPILMQDFDPKTSETMDFDAQPGFCILGGVVNDAFGDGEDKITLMVLADSGELLILSGYNLARDHHALYLFLTELLDREIPGIGYREPEGTYLAWLDTTALAPDNPSRHFAEHGVVTTDGAACGLPGFTRLNLAASRGPLEQAVARMAASL